MGVIVDVFSGVVTPGDATPDVEEAVGVGPEADTLKLEADKEVEDVVLALVLAPNTAPCKVKTAFSVLQHLCLSASLSQQYFASSAYP